LSTGVISVLLLIVSVLYMKRRNKVRKRLII
jgi:hypothetical protein